MLVRYPSGIVCERKGHNLLLAIVFGKAELCKHEDRRSLESDYKTEIKLLENLRENAEMYNEDKKFYSSQVQHQHNLLVEAVYDIGI